MTEHIATWLIVLSQAEYEHDVDQMAEARGELDRLLREPVAALTDDDEDEQSACQRCGAEPSRGYASIYAFGRTTWLCHGEDDAAPTCYEQGPRPVPSAVV